MLNELPVDEFDCVVPAIGQRFFYIVGGKTFVVEARLNERVNSCTKNNGCFFQDKENECPGFACSRVERKDSFDIKFVDVTNEYNDQELTSFLWVNVFNKGADNVVIMFEHGELKKTFPNIREAAIGAKLTQGKVRDLLASGMEEQGISFDMAIAGVKYKKEEK